MAVTVQHKRALFVGLGILAAVTLINLAWAHLAAQVQCPWFR